MTLTDREPQRPAESDSAPQGDPITWRGVGSALRQAWAALRRLHREPRLTLVALLAILILAGALRFTGLDWDKGQHLHPDERFLTMVENSLRWPRSLGEYWDTASNPLNPNNHSHGTYVYGLFPVVVTKFVGQALGKTGYNSIYLVGRALSGCMDMLSIVLVFMLGRRLYGSRVGLLGALLGALTVLTIQQSHFFTVDNFTTLFVTLALYAAVCVAQGDGWPSVALLGVAFGLAVSAKISVLTFALIIGLAFVLRVLRRSWPQGLGETSPDCETIPTRRGAAGAPPEEARERRLRLGRFALRWRVEADPSCGPLALHERLFLGALRSLPAFLLVLVVAFWVFRIVQPQAFTGPGFLGLSINQKWAETMTYIRDLVGGKIDYPPSHQWTDRAPVLYMLQHMVLWGLGLPLGLAVWASWLWMGWELYQRRWAHLLPWAWMTLAFFYQSVQFVKTVRYLLPIYPTMALIAAYGLVRLWDAARQWDAARDEHAVRRVERRRWARPVAGGLIAVVVVGTACWALALTSIYTRPVSRVAASRWIYDNIPKGASLSYELWDDALPLNIDGRLAGSDYRQVRMEPYGEDTPAKREQLYDWLERTEYIIFSSNRLYDSIPRLPTRYPMTTRYYEALFSGELGYDRLITFTSYPRLFGIEIVDDAADESFTVYDHPKVSIFQKRPDFDIERVRTLFDGYDLERVVRLMPNQVTGAPNGLMLTEEEWGIQRAGGTWSRLFDRDDLANRAPVPVWLLTILLLGWVAFPLCFAALRGLRDRGYALAKIVGLLLVGYLSWLLPSLKWTPFGGGLVWGALLLLALLAGWAARRQRAELRAFVSARWRLIVANELLFAAFFVALLLVRRGNPDLWHPVMGGEKPMDLAYLNAILKSTHFPPYDPWFAGGYINYYYLGWVLVAAVIKLTGIVPTVAYNLALPTLFALVATGATCVVYNLIPAEDDESGWFPRALRYGLAGACLVAVVGNLGELKLLVEGFRQVGQSLPFGSSLPGLEPLVRLLAGAWQVIVRRVELPFRSEWWYWNASRIMQHGEINEFPFFSFLYADLHAHVLAMPLGVLALGLAVSFVKRLRARYRASASGESACDSHRLRATLRRGLAWLGLDGVLLLQLGLAGLTLGALWCSNSWDYPTYALVLVTALAIGQWAERPQLDRRALVQLACRCVLVLASSYLLFRPYHARFGLAYAEIGRWEGEQASLGEYLLIHLLPLFILTSYLLTLTLGRGMRNGVARALKTWWGHGRRRWRAWDLYALLVRCPTLAFSFAWWGLGMFGALWLILVMSRAHILALAAPLLLLATGLVFYGRATPERRLQTLWIALGLAMTVGVEYVVIKGDVGRMNTVFKFYLQVWLLWSVVAGVALAHLSRAVRAWAPRWRRAWRWALGLLVCAAALYPVFGAYGKVGDRWDPALPPSLDGMAYMTTVRYDDQGRSLTLAHDREAILWMQDHIAGSPVIAEANTPLYRWGGRISVYTGLPSIVGWDWHQKQQRAAYSGVVVDWRLQDVSDLFNTTDIALAREILARYQVGYVYVGELEAAYYSPAGLDKFAAMVGADLAVAYRHGPVTIYRVLAWAGQEGAFSSRSTWGAARDWLARHWLPSRVQAQGPEQSDANPMLDVPVDELPVLRDRGWNRAANDSPALAILVWWLAIQALGWAAWPLTRRMVRASDGGYALSKGIGLLAASYLVWLGASMRIAPNSPVTAWGAVLLVAFGALLLWRRRRGQTPHRRQALDLRLILFEEGLFSLALGALVALRLLNPDLWQPWFGGEKMMEIAFLNALTRSAYMPPYDPYFAGGVINYYYYGYVLVNTLIKLTGLRPEIAFNLAVPTFFALMVSHVFWVGRRLATTLWGDQRGRTRAGYGGGLAAVALVCLLGNLSGIIQVIQGAATAGGALFDGSQPWWRELERLGIGLWGLVTGRATLDFDYWWAATRVIPGAINEFPFFTFLFADLHPHLINLPFTVLALALVSDMTRASDRWLAPDLVRWAALAGVLGALGAINTWDMPVYLAIASVSLLWVASRSGRLKGMLIGGVGVAAISLAAFLFYGPFYAHYRPQHLGLGWAPSELRARPAAMATIWTLPLFLVFSILLWKARGWAPWRIVALALRWGWHRTWRRLAALGPGAGWVIACGTLTLGLGALLVWLAVRGEPVIAALSLALALAGWALVRNRGDQRAPVYLLVFAGIGVLLGAEIVYLKDFMDGSEWRRMNTVFKFGLQAWVLLNLAAGAFLPILWRRARLGRLWRATVALLVLAAALYPLLAVPVRVAERFPQYPGPRGTLDGTAYMLTATYTWPDDDSRIAMAADREAIAWLWEQVQGTPVIAEAPVGFYREGGLRVSSYTGFPTLVGAHQNEQRPWDAVAARESDAWRIYNSRDSDEVAGILDRYRVRYVYVGPLERMLYGEHVLVRLDDLVERGELTRVYENEGVVIYGRGG
jgi:YYY domain-containing protein